MSENKIITINGQRYDAQTGLPVVGKKAPQTLKHPTPAASVHSTTQKSQTLIRRLTKKPAPSVKPRSVGQVMDIARSSKIARFAPHPLPKTPPVAIASPDIAPRVHPLANRAHVEHARKQQVAPVIEPKSSKQVKNEAISIALAKPTPKPARKSFFKRHPRLVSITSISIVVVLLGAYFTYTNIPSLSVRVAAAQAGINASYPDYRPDGYSLGQVTYSDGQVTIHFTANTGSSQFALKQEKSSWDSSAVLDKIVRAKVGDAYITSQESGLTIFTYSGNAAWVNAGILYTIDGDAPLSGEQIRHIATSL